MVKVLAQGETKASVILAGGIQCDFARGQRRGISVRAGVFHRSKEHNIVMRQRAIQRGQRLNEYGLFKSKEETRDPKLLVRARRKTTFLQAGLTFVPPELREDHGEFLAAEKNGLRSWSSGRT